MLEHDDILEIMIDRSARASYSPLAVRRMQAERWKTIEQALDELYDLACFEAYTHHDGYFEEKQQFIRHGMTYGYISSYVRQNQGNNEFVFYKRTISDGKDGQPKNIHRKTIDRVNKTYTARSFKPHAGHEAELKLALTVEEHFVRLREEGRIYRRMKRELSRLKSRKMTPYD